MRRQRTQTIKMTLIISLWLWLWIPFFCALFLILSKFIFVTLAFKQKPPDNQKEWKISPRLLVGRSFNPTLSWKRKKKCWKKNRKLHSITFWKWNKSAFNDNRLLTFIYSANAELTHDEYIINNCWWWKMTGNCFTIWILP